MSQAILTHISWLNNSAVVELAEGKIDQAITHLEQALQRFHRALDVEEPQEQNITKLPAEADIEAVTIDPELGACDRLCAPGNAFRVYDAAFSLRLGRLNRENVALVVLYNFGLAQLRKGTMLGKDSLLFKSSKIHAMATSLLQGDSSATQRGSFNLLRLALLTNKGFLHAYFMDFERAQNCKDQVKVLLAESHCMSHMNPVDLSFFRLTIGFIELFGLPMHLPPAA